MTGPKTELLNPVFIVGMNGSGTGALTRGLAQHSDLYAFPGETRIFGHYLQTEPQFGDLSDDDNFRALLRDVRTNSALTARHGDQEVPEPEDWRELPRTVGGALDAAFGYFMRRDGARRWCEKTPMNALHIERLAAAFPDAQFFHIIRDGRDAALSFERRFGYSPELSIFRWKRTVASARAQGERIGADRYMEMRYEALTDEPDAQMRRALEFLGLAFEDSVLAPRQRSGKEMLASGFVANSQKWREGLNARDLARLEGIAGKMLGELGYEVTNASGDADLSPLRQRLIHNRDGARAIGNNVRSILKNPRKGMLRRLGRALGRVNNGMRQARANRGGDG
ncbi:MAG: sulfotransferase [Pseudomonadota bacterium]